MADPLGEIRGSSGQDCSTVASYVLQIGRIKIAHGPPRFEVGLCCLRRPSWSYRPFPPRCGVGEGRQVRIVEIRAKWGDV